MLRTSICRISVAGTASQHAGRYRPMTTITRKPGSGTPLTISQRTPPTAEQADKQPLHIPFSIELYDNEGKAIPLQKGGHPVHHMLNVTQAETDVRL